MQKTIKRVIFAVTAAAVVSVSAALSACTIKTKHPRAEISIEFQGVTYDIEYTLYRNMYPATVQHFIELADAGFYDNTVIHDYKSNDWFTGAYTYKGEYTTNYEQAYADGAMQEYFEEHSNEEQYYALASSLTPTVYKNLSYDGKGNQTVNVADALPTLIGEFSANDHTIDKGALSAGYGVLKMFYYSKGDTNQKVAIKNSFGELMEHDYKYNCATSVFGIQTGTTSSYSATSYCIFGQLRNDSNKEKLQNLQEAISDYITDNLGGSSSKFTTSVTMEVDNLDTFAEEGGQGISVTFAATAQPIVVKSVKITKY